MRSDWNMYNSPFIHSAAQLHLSPGQMLYSDSCHLIFILIFSSMCQIICLQIIPQGSVSCCSCRKEEIKVTFDLDVDWSLTSLLPQYLATECCSQYTPTIEHKSLPRKTVKSYSCKYPCCSTSSTSWGPVSPCLSPLDQTWKKLQVVKAALANILLKNIKSRY